MPNLTNHYHLPQPLVNAVMWSDRDREGCDYTVTELLRPARQVALEQIHRDEITEDASDRLWLLLGSAGHKVLERSADSGIIEKRFIVEFEVDGKMFKVGGKVDYIDTSLRDYKFCSVWTAKEGPRDEWVQQQNCYHFLAARNAVEFDKLQIVAIFRDWSKPKASREPDYPQSQVKVFDLPLWRDDSTEQFIIDRIRAHEAAKTTLPECTPEEMWEKPAVWAVKKPGNKRAIKLCASEEDAEAFIRGMKASLDIEHRPAERPRCESYCRCGGDSGICQQWVKFKQQNP